MKSRNPELISNFIVKDWRNKYCNVAAISVGSTRLNEIRVSGKHVRAKSEILFVEDRNPSHLRVGKTDNSNYG